TLGKTEKDDAGVRAELAQDKPLKIAVVCDEDAAFSFGDGQHIFIRQGGGIVADDSGHVVPAVSQESGQAQFSVFIQQEFHTLRWGMVAGFVARLVLPTLRWA